MKSLSGRTRAKSPPAQAWHERTFHAVAEINAIIQHILALMHTAGYSDKDQFAVRLALEEALVNVVKHGNAADPGKKVIIAYHIKPDEVVTRIEDEGRGFNPCAIPDPLAPENLERPGGRGVFLMRHYMTSVEFNDRGNCVTLAKSRSR
jgi:serine/threonine-protein kinase RsbW